LKFIFYLFLLLFTLLSAAELVTKSHLLKSGDLITFYPKQGETLSVSKDFTHLTPGANYDIVMKNGTRVYFENRNQEDDMYIIFNDATEPGDVVQIKVNRGYFNYTTQSFEALPQTVKKVLQVSTNRKKSDKHIEYTQDAVVETEEFCFDAMGNIVECQSVLTSELVSEKKVQESSSSPSVISKPVSDVVSHKHKKEKNETNFLDLFAQKVKKAFSSITKNLRDVKESEGKVSNSQSKLEKSVRKNADKPLNTTSQNIKQTDISKYNTPYDQNLIAGKFLPAPQFHRLLQNAGITESFDHSSIAAQVPRLQSSPVVVSEQKPAAELYHKPAIVGQMKFSPYDNLDQSYPEPTYKQPVVSSFHEKKRQFSEVRRPDLKVSTPAFAQNKFSNETKTVKPTLRKRSAHPDDFAGSHGNRFPSAVSKPQIASRRGVSSYETKVAQNSVSGKMTQPDLHRVAPQIPSQTVPEVISEPGLIQRAVPQVKPVAPVVSETFSKPVIEPVAPPEIEPQEPVVAETPEAPKEESAPSNKIVITKIINKKQPPAQTAPLERMSDRLLGGGYSEQHAMGQVGVKAYSNKKPISAWVEVYKGKRRVKTFYTGAGKLVKLPAGTYVLKATYRTGTAKQKKSLGRVELHEGDVIRKKVYFNVGKLNIVAKRKGKPVYVKVEIYKNGSKRRYAYTFSSQRTGEVHLQLAEGKYKIVILEHGERKVFDNVRIKGNASKTLRVEF